MNLRDRLREFQKIAENPREAVEREIIRTGKPAIGCFLAFCPEELIYAAGVLPVGMWGKVENISEAKKYFPSFFCLPIQQNLEIAMRHGFDGMLSGVVIPIYCDALKAAGQNWKIAVPHIPVIPFVYPVKRDVESAMVFLQSEYEQIKEKLEMITGKIIKEEELEQAIVLYNSYRQEGRRFCCLAKKHLNVITPIIRHNVLMAAYYMDKARYIEMLREVNQDLETLSEETFKGEKVILSGVEFSEKLLLKELEKQNIAVVADNLIQESVNLQADVPDIEEEALLRIARRWQNQKHTSVVLDVEDTRESFLIRQAKEEHASVIFSLTSFCDPEEYDYPLIKQSLKKENISQLFLELNGRESVEQARTRIQAFAEQRESER